MELQKKPIITHHESGETTIIKPVSEAELAIIDHTTAKAQMDWDASAEERARSGERAQPKIMDTPITRRPEWQQYVQKFLRVRPL